MPISHDLRNIQATLSAILDRPESMPTPEMVVMEQDIPFVRLLCANIASLADRVEALEDAPLAFDSCDFTYLPTLSQNGSCGLTTQGMPMANVVPLQ